MKSTAPVVTIIIIFYNAERFIANAIDSVLAQTFDDWELLLVDDGSTDGSCEIAKYYSTINSDKIRYLEHEGHYNRGMSVTRNLGIRNARGGYLAFLDADDVWLPHKLAHQVAILEAHPQVAMTYGVTQYWYGWTGAPEDAEKDHARPLGVNRDSLMLPPMLLALALESTAPTPCPSDIMIRRTAVKAVGGFEENFNGLFEDQAFLSKVYLRESVFVSGEPLLLYRQHDASCISIAERANLKYAAGLYYLDWLKTYFDANKITDERLWRALEEKRRRYHKFADSSLATWHGVPQKLWDSSKWIARRALPVAIYDWVKAQITARPSN